MRRLVDIGTGLIAGGLWQRSAKQVGVERDVFGRHGLGTVGSGLLETEGLSLREEDVVMKEMIQMTFQLGERVEVESS